ncbi:unnamed protein product [Moneuplotes crassus]|uniref:Uncharacterized protein n=1 Tax=Euplotes crassus TaxID=5936 RepID=A0AAD1UJ69_EUPCR|nr:unnamed protein product [Moneuplotes crassus]
MKYSKYSKHPANCLSPLNAPDISRDNSKSKFKPANENVAMSSFSSKSVSLEGSIHLKNAVHDQNEINIESHFQSEIQSICDDNISESRERILEGLKAVENGNQKYLNQNPSHESDRVIDFLEDNFNRDLQIESSRLKDNLAVDLSYDKHKQLKLSHRNGTKDRKLLDLIQKFKLENTELVNKISSNPVENTKKKKTILLLLNELRHQIAKNCKERGDVLTKLWKSYFREISGDQNRQIQHKNECIIILLQNISDLKTRLDEKNLRIMEVEEVNINLIDANKGLQDMLDEAKSIYNSQKQKILDQERIQKEIEDEFYFWLPGYEYYSKDKIYKEKLEKINPVRQYDEYTQDFEDNRFLLFGDANRLLKAVNTKSEFEFKFQKAEEMIDALDSEISNMKKAQYELGEEVNKLQEVIKEKDYEIHKLERQLVNVNDSLSYEKVHRFHHDAVSVHIQTDEDLDFLELLNGSKRGRNWHLKKKMSKKKSQKFQKLERAKTVNENTYVEVEINKILRKTNFNPGRTSVFSLKNCLQILKEACNRRLEIFQEKNSMKRPPELRTYLYEEMLKRCKNEKIAVRQYEQFILCLKRFKTQDYRIDLFKRFLVYDEETFSEEIFESVLKILTYLKLDRVFSLQVQDVYIPLSNAEQCILRIFPNSPKILRNKVLSSVQHSCKVFLNTKLVTISRDDVKYYKILKEIYTTIIVKWNSSVAKVFIEAFKLKKENKGKMIMKKDFESFLTKVMKIDLNSIERDSLSFNNFFTKFFDPKQIGCTNLASILSAFRTKVDISVALPKLLFIAVNYIVEFENFIHTETDRVYSMYEDHEHKGIDYENLENALNKIAYNSENIYLALADVREIKGASVMDKQEFEILTRKHRVFEESSYLDEAFSIYDQSTIFKADTSKDENSLAKESDELIKEENDSKEDDEDDVKKITTFQKPPKAQSALLKTIDKYHKPIGSS